MNVDAQPVAPPRLLRLPQVIERTGFGRSFIYKAVAEGGFPQPLAHRRCKLFVEAEVDAWVRSRIAERKGGSGITLAKLLVTEDELASALGVSTSFLQKDRTRATPSIPHVKLGAVVRYDLEAVRAALARLTRGGKDVKARR